MAIYAQQKTHMHAYKREIILALLLITLLLLFTTTWVALFLSKQVTVPIQALAEATREISRGNFDHRIDVQAQDELGTLVRSFNRMTEQLGEGRRQINEFTQSLEQAVEERERRRKLMEAILENIPTGVVSLDSSGNIARVNSAVATILGEHARKRAHSLRAARRRSGARRAAPDAAIVANGRGVARDRSRRRRPPGSRSGYRDFAGAAPVESGIHHRDRRFDGFAARAEGGRMAGSGAANRARNQESADADSAFGPTPAAASRPRFRGESRRPRTDFEKLAAECAALIEREVQTLESLVDEFSQFARFPSARLAAADLNAIVSSALDLFQGRLEGITVRANLASSLPCRQSRPRAAAPRDRELDR